jgi:uncharacterized membrane protein YdjX (TVP38/TMEM64 family)
LTEPATTEEEAATPRRGEAIRRALLVVLALGAAVALYLSGAFEDPEHTVEVVRAAGAWGAIAYVAAFALLQPLGISGHVFGLAAAAIWGGAGGFALALLGAVGSACVSFAYARYVAYDWVQSRIPARVRKYESWVVERGLLGVVAYRLLTFTMHPAQLLMGTLRVRFGTMVLGTTVGFAPAVAIDVFLGGQLWDWLIR